MDQKQTNQILTALPAVKRLRKLADLRQERFEYSKKRLGTIQSLLGDARDHIGDMESLVGTVSSVFAMSDLSDMSGHRHALSMEARTKLTRMFEALNAKVSEIKKQAGIS